MRRERQIRGQLEQQGLKAHKTGGRSTQCSGNTIAGRGGGRNSKASKAVECAESPPAGLRQHEAACSIRLRRSHRGVRALPLNRDDGSPILNASVIRAAGSVLHLMPTSRKSCGSRRGNRRSARDTSKRESQGATLTTLISLRRLKITAFEPGGPRSVADQNTRRARQSVPGMLLAGCRERFAQKHGYPDAFTIFGRSLVQQEGQMSTVQIAQCRTPTQLSSICCLQASHSHPA